jgi:hypothetical protein
MPRKPTVAKRRITLNLPTNFLLQAQKVARSRRVSMSMVISEFVSAGLKSESAKHRRTQVIENYRRAFSALSPDEAVILDEGF